MSMPSTACINQLRSSELNSEPTGSKNIKLGTTKVRWKMGSGMERDGERDGERWGAGWREMESGMERDGEREGGFPQECRKLLPFSIT